MKIACCFIVRQSSNCFSSKFPCAQLISLTVCVCIVEAVRDVVCSRLLPAWLLRLDGNIIELLHRLDVENCSQTALDTLKAIFTGTPTEELLQNRLQLDNRYTHILQTLL